MNLFNFDAGYIVEPFFYFSSNLVNGLFRKNLETGIVEYVAMFDGEKICKPHLHQKCLKWEKWLVFIPCLASHIHLYNVNNGNVKAVPVSSLEFSETYSDGFIYDDKLYLFPKKMKYGLIVYDLQEDCFINDTFFDDWCAKTFDEITYSKLAFNRVCRRDEIVCVPTLEEGYVIQLNLEKQEIFLYETSINDHFLLAPYLDNKWIGCTNRNDIFVFNNHFAEEDVVSSFFIYNDCQHEIMNIIPIRDGLLILPGFEACIYKLSFPSMKMIQLHVDMGDEYDEGDFFFYGYFNYENKTIVFPRNSNRSICIDDEISYEEFGINLIEYKDAFPSHYRKIKENLMNRDVYIEEKESYLNGNLCLSDFLALV